MKLTTIIKKGLAKYRGRPSYKSARVFAGHLSRHLSYVGSEVTLPDIVGYRTQRDMEGASPATINREVGLLRTILRDAEDSGIEVKYPNRWRSVHVPPRHRVLTRSEFCVLRDVAFKDKQHWWTRNMLRLLTGTGCRIGEILNAQWLDYDTEYLTIIEPKEGESKVVALENGALEAANALSRRARGLGLPRPFARGKGTTPDNEIATFRRRLAAGCERVGIPLARPHDLRRTFASWAIEAGATLEQVGQCLGHKTYETTRKYVRIDRSSRRAVAALVST